MDSGLMNLWGWRHDRDQWKTRSPDDERFQFYPYDYGEEEREPEDDCTHEDYERDILTGRATCNSCDHHWYLSDERVLADMGREAQYDEWQRRQDRREFWRRLSYPIRWPIFRVLERVWPRKACSVLLDDEIPF